MTDILFFSRLELTNFFGRLDKYLSKDFNIYHLAYSNHERETLLNTYGIKEVFDFKKMIAELLPKCKLDLSLINKIDELFITVSNGRFSLNSAIRYDRSFRFLKYEDCLLLSQCYFLFWSNFLDEHPVQAVFHEPPAIFITHLLANLAKQRKILFLSQSQVVGKNKFNWIMIEGDNGYPIELAKNLSSLEISEEDLENAKNFISDFRKKSEILFSEYTSNQAKKNKYSCLSNFAKISIRALKRKSLENNEGTKLLNHLEDFIDKSKPSFLEQLYNNWYYNTQLEYDSFNKNADYYFYPLHAEPEAAVLYRGDGVYEGQVKLIENLAEQLPPNCLLYIKDHPHRPAFTDMTSFKRLKLIPNVRLLDPELIGTEIIRHSKGVITISGTGGFEAILLNKQVYVFGNTFYSLCKRVIYVKNIRDFRSIIYENFNRDYLDDYDFFHFINVFLKSSHQGFVSYFPRIVKSYNLNHEENIKNIADEFKKTLSTLIS